MTQKIMIALLCYVAATAISVALFRGRGVGLILDTALLFAFFFCLATLRSPRGT